MKKIINQILLVVLVIIIGMSSVLITNVSASSPAGVAVSAATVGETFTVGLNLPSNAIGAQCTITVKYSNGESETKKLVYAKGMENMGFSNSVNFVAKAAGKADIDVLNIILSDANNQQIGETGNKYESITVKEKASSNTGSSGSSNGGNSSDSSNAGTVAPTNTTNNQGGTTTETPKEPEVVNPTFKDVNETVYAVSGCNVRSSCSSSISSNKIGGLKEGQSVTRTGYHNEWSRISYNGKTAYVATRLLTTEAPKVEENTVTNTAENTAVKNEVTNKVENTVENNTIENEVVNETVDQNAILGNLQNEIGVLPEVGRNIADYMFMLVSFIALSIIMIVNYKLKNKSL